MGLFTESKAADWNQTPESIQKVIENAFQYCNVKIKQKQKK
jgi:hypothetical protein